MKQGLYSSKCHDSPDAVEPSAIEVQPSALRLPSTEVPQLSSLCPTRQDHFNHGMPRNGQNILSMTAAGMHEPGRPASPGSSTGSVRGSVHVKPAATASVDSSREQPIHVLKRHQVQAYCQAPCQQHDFPAHAHDAGLPQPGLQTEHGWDDSNPDKPFAPIGDSKPDCKSSRARQRHRNRQPHPGTGAAAQLSAVTKCQDHCESHPARQENSQGAAARSSKQEHHILGPDTAQPDFGASPRAPLTNPLPTPCQPPRHPPWHPAWLQPSAYLWA